MIKFWKKIKGHVKRFEKTFEQTFCITLLISISICAVFFCMFYKQLVNICVPVGSSTPQVEDSSFCMDMSSSLSMKCDFSSNSISPYVSSGDANTSIGIGRPLNPTPQKAGIKTSTENTSTEKRLQTIDEMKTANVVDDQGILFILLLQRPLCYEFISTLSSHSKS